MSGSGKSKTAEVQQVTQPTDLQVLACFVVGHLVAVTDQDTAMAIFEAGGLKHALDESTDQRHLLVLTHELVKFGILPAEVGPKLPELEVNLARYDNEPD